MDEFDQDPRLEHVQSRDGREALKVLIESAKRRKYHLSCGGTAVPHVQFRQTADERPYSYSLLLNPRTPTFYVRKPANSERREVLSQFQGAHENRAGEIKIPVPDARTARRVAERFI
jgi:hypothetical protein